MMKKLVLLAFTTVATLLLPNKCHGRLMSSSGSTIKLSSEGEDGDQKIVMNVINDSTQQLDEKLESNTLQNDAMIVDFFHEDYWYSFRPLEQSTQEGALQQWEVQRIPITTNMSRRLQSTTTEEVEPFSINNDGEGISTDAQINAGESNGGNEEYIKTITNVLLSLSCVCMAALAAGLTLGMLSLDPLSLEIKRRASTDRKEQQWSECLLPMLVGHSKRHRLLVSLLLLNSLANEALPLFLDELLPGKYATIIFSVVIVLFFGEIVPSAFFTGPNQVEVAAKLVPLAKFVMFILAPIAVPIAKLLDRVLHDDSHSGSADFQEDVTEGNYYNRTELTALVRIQYESQLADKRRRKQEQKLLLTSSNGGSLAAANNTTPRMLPIVETVMSRVSKQTSVNGSERSSTSINHTHHSIRSISRELTASNRPSVDGGFSSSLPVRMPSIHRDEITMIEGALTMTTKRAADVLTPLRRVYALPHDTVLDEETMVEIWRSGFSRIPVFVPNEPEPSFNAASDMRKVSSASSFEDVSGIMGVLLARQLIVVDSGESRPISTLPLVKPSCISPSMHLVDLINLFQASGGRGKGGLHLAIVCARPSVATTALENGDCIPKEAGVVGIITLEDVVEELLQEEIYDEADRDLELSRWGVFKWKAFVKRRKLKRLQEQQKKSAGAVIMSAPPAVTTESTPLLEG